MDGLRKKQEPRTNALTAARRKRLAMVAARKGIHYAKHLKQDLEAFNNKAASIQMRKDILDKQRQGDYQKEFENIRGILSHSTIPFETVRRLRERKDKLKELGARAVNID